MRIDGSIVKAARNVRGGETIIVRVNDVVRTVRVLGVTERRIGPKMVAEYYDDLTPPEEWERNRRSHVDRILSRPKGTGRPTKRDRRKIDDWLP